MVAGLLEAKVPGIWLTTLEMAAFPVDVSHHRFVGTAPASAAHTRDEVE